MAPIRWRLVGCQGPLWSTCASSMMMWRFGHRTEDIFEIQPHVHSAFRTVSNLIPMQCLGSDLQHAQHSRGVAITLLAAQLLVPTVRPLPPGAAAQRLALGLLLTPRAPAELIVSPDVLETIGQQLVGYDHETECTKWNDQGQEAMEARAQFVPLPQDCLWETAADAAMRSVGWYWHGPEKRAVGFLMEGSKIPTADERQMRLGSYDGIYRVVHEHNGWPILSNQAGLFCYPTLVDEWKSFRPHSQEEPNGAEAVRWCLAPTWRSCGPNCPPTPGRIFDAVLSRGERGDTVEQPNGEDVELTTLYPLCVPDYTAEPSLAMGEHVWEYRDGSMMEWFGHKLTTSLLMDEEQADEAEASLPVK